MKMTLMLWRTVSVWLCVAVVFVCLSSHVNCTEPHKEAQRPESPQDVHLEEGLGLTTDNKKPEPTQSISETLHLKDEEEQQQRNEFSIKGRNQLQQQILELEVPVENEMTVDEEQIQNEHQQYSETPAPETSTGNELDTPSSLPDSEQYSSFAAEFKHGSNQHIQEEMPNGISHSDATVADVIEPDLVNCEVEPNPFDSESSPPVVLENTSNAHTTGTKTISDPPLSSPAAHSTQHPEANVSHVLMEQDLSSPVATETDASVGSKDPEDIPTFDEWKRKMMEVEKEKTVITHTSNNGAAHPVKKVPKNFNNYASVECGAKILGANSEAKSTSAILKENMDLYMLNPCSNKIWFIIELCEPIQVKQLDIANFELFSSTPKDFLVSISDRYPTNKWLKLGTFHARDERTVQSFPLDEQLYAKYVKVELVSHFGSEHFCPLSLIRVFGTSMVEEYELIADPSERSDDQDDDMDYPAGYAPGEVDPKNLIGSAKDAIFNIVKDIAVVLGGSQGNITSQEENMTEPSIQLETTSDTTTTDLAPDPDLVDLSVTGTDTSDTTTPDPPVTEPNNEEHATQEEQQIVVPLDKDDEEPIESTITLLDKEEETDEDKENQRGSADYCELFPLSFPTCSCATSLHEYLIQQCLLHLPKKYPDCQTADKMQTAGDAEVPNWSNVDPQIEQPQNGIFEDVEREQDSLSGHEKYIEIFEHDHKMPVSESLPIEPSLTTDLPTDSPTTKATPVVETPQSVTEEPVRKPILEMTLDSAAEEKHIEPTGTYSSALSADTGASTAVEYDSPALSQEKTNVDRQQEIKDTRDQNQDFYPETPPSKHHPEENILKEVTTEMPQPHTIPDPLPSDVNIIDSKIDDFAEDLTTTAGNSRPTAATPSPSDIYADPANGTEQSGNALHGSSQKESVFMRLNNRIKALEMNMSLSGRYLEQLSQRYRKQMEEMQKAFNKTVIKLQNTSRVAEEQDLRQTESIQLLQGQLENVTRLVLNLSVVVSQLRNEVSDRESYLLLSLLLCLCMILLLYINRCRTSSTSTPEAESPSPESYTYCCPERHFSSEEAALKRSASYPLIHSESFKLASTMGPEILQHEETQSLCPASRKRRRRKLKSLENVETLKPSLHVAPEQVQTKGRVLCNGAPVPTDPTPLTQSLTRMLLEPTFRDSEGSSEGSSHSDDPSFCGISAACTRICDGLPPETRAERRALRRRRPKHCGVVDHLKAPSRDKRHSLPIYTIQDIMDRQEQSSNTYGMNVNISGPV